jgi:hypothetical protein
MCARGHCGRTGLRWGTPGLLTCAGGTPKYAPVASLTFCRSGCCTDDGSRHRPGLLVIEVIIFFVVVWALSVLRSSIPTPWFIACELEAVRRWLVANAVGFGERCRRGEWSPLLPCRCFDGRLLLSSVVCCSVCDEVLTVDEEDILSI